MKRRLTIPVFKWRLAIHLEATRNLQNQKGTPAHNCECDLCRLWREAYPELIPETLLSELKRVGIDLNFPTEFYDSNSNSDTSDMCCRIMFHAVGKVLSGPGSSIANKRLGENVMNYITVREQPYFSIMVLSERNSYEAAPVLTDSSVGEILCFDIRFNIHKPPV